MVSGKGPWPPVQTPGNSQAKPRQGLKRSGCPFREQASLMRREEHMNWHLYVTMAFAPSKPFPVGLGIGPVGRVQARMKLQPAQGCNNRRGPDPRGDSLLPFLIA
jgi:hypothetical protein